MGNDIYPVSRVSGQFLGVPVQISFHSFLAHQAKIQLMRSTYITNVSLLVDFGLEILENAMVDHLVSVELDVWWFGR